MSKEISKWAPVWSESDYEFSIFDGEGIHLFDIPRNLDHDEEVRVFLTSCGAKREEARPDYCVVLEDMIREHHVQADCGEGYERRRTLLRIETLEVALVALRPRVVSNEMAFDHATGDLVIP